MTKLFDQAIQKAIEAAKQLSPKEQDDLASAIIHLVDEDDDHLDADLREALAEVDRGEIASDEEVEAVLSRLRPKA